MTVTFDKSAQELFSEKALALVSGRLIGTWRASRCKEIGVTTFTLPDGSDTFAIEYVGSGVEYCGPEGLTYDVFIYPCWPAAGVSKEVDAQLKEMRPRYDVYKNEAAYKRKMKALIKKLSCPPGNS